VEYSKLGLRKGFKMKKLLFIALALTFSVGVNAAVSSDSSGTIVITSEAGGGTVSTGSDGSIVITSGR